MLKYIKILKGTPTCFDLNRSSSGSRSVPWSSGFYNQCFFNF